MSARKNLTGTFARERFWANCIDWFGAFRCTLCMGTGRGTQKDAERRYVRARAERGNKVMRYFKEPDHDGIQFAE